MTYPPLSLIRPSVRRRLRDLLGADRRAARLDRGRVEAALHRQMRALGIDRPIVWQDGLGAARAMLIAEALAPLTEELPAIARATARAVSRERGLRLRVPDSVAEQRAFVTAAAAAARRAAFDITEPPITAAILDPLHAERTSHPWNARWGDGKGRMRARGAITDLYLACRQAQSSERAVRACNDTAREGIMDGPPPPSFAADWMRAWMIAWAETLECPAGEDPYDEALQATWDRLLENAGVIAGDEVLAAARANAYGAFVEEALDPVYGAWCALGEVNAGGPGGDLARPWRGVLRSFWLPFLPMAVGGLALYWATPAVVVCLPRPALFLAGGDRTLVVWQDGESHSFHADRLAG